MWFEVKNWRVTAAGCAVSAKVLHFFEIPTLSARVLKYGGAGVFLSPQIGKISGPERKITRPEEKTFAEVVSPFFEGRQAAALPWIPAADLREKNLP
ncbi:MAG: hypothetical protein ACI353_04450 [Alloprevotella sp.]